MTADQGARLRLAAPWRLLFQTVCRGSDQQIIMAGALMYQADAEKPAVSHLHAFLGKPHSQQACRTSLATQVVADGV